MVSGKVFQRRAYLSEYEVGHDTQLSSLCWVLPWGRERRQLGGKQVHAHKPKSWGIQGGQCCWLMQPPWLSPLSLASPPGSRASPG